VRKVIACISLIALVGCAILQPKKTGPEADYQNASRLIQEKKYEDAIAACRKVADSSPQSPVAADALYNAAYLNVFHDNPHKDFGQALAGFDEFLKRYPHHAKAQDARNWRSALKVIVEVRKENDRLNKKIEGLKKLDIRHEERRRK
jgi:outer membrane protein assembly factor BamD (BamD/ComL family)